MEKNILCSQNIEFFICINDIYSGIDIDPHPDTHTYTDTDIGIYIHSHIEKHTHFEHILSMTLTRMHDLNNKHTHN